MAAAAPSTLTVAIVPLIALLPAVLCMLDITRHPHTRNLRPRVWLVICAFGNLIGLAAYLVYGQSDDR